MIPGKAVYFVGVDVGTGSARACIIDTSGNQLSYASHDIQTWQSQSACYQQSTTDIWKSICRAVKDAVSSARIDASQIASIAFAATCSLAAFDRSTRAPVRMDVRLSSDTNSEQNVILWRHHAATREAELINDTRHDSLRYLGGSISPLMALAKVLWLKNNMPRKSYERCRFYDLHDALTDIATGGKQLQCEPVCAHISEPEGFGIDGTLKGWTDSLIEEIGLAELAHDRSERVGGYCSNGKLIPVGTPVGTLSEQAAQELGLSRTTLVSSGVIDCYAGWAGTAGTRTSELNIPVGQRIALVAGTSACHVLASDRQNFVQGVWGPYKDFLLPNKFTVVGGQSAVGHLIQHVVTTHPAYHEARSLTACSDLTIFEFLNKHLDSLSSSTDAPHVAFLARHLHIYGDHFGNRSPIADPRMTGSVTGLTGDTTLDNLAITYYATLEFLALQTRHIIDTISTHGHTVGAIFMSGSLCLNRKFVDILATACRLPVVIPEAPQSVVSHGSALLAATAWRNTQGEGHDLLTVMESMTKPGRICLPLEDERFSKLLDVKYKILLLQIEQQRMFRDMIDRVIRNQ